LDLGLRASSLGPLPWLNRTRQKLSRRDRYCLKRSFLDHEMTVSLQQADLWSAVSEIPSQMQEDARQPVVQQITRKNILHVLIVGFALVTLLLLAAGFIGVTHIHAIQESATSLFEEQLVTTRLIDELQREQGTLSAVFYHLEQGPESVDREAILAQLNTADEHIDRIISSMAASRDPLWGELRSASASFSAAARHLLASPGGAPVSSHELLRRHDQVIAIVTKLIATSHDKAMVAHTQINRRSGEVVRRSLLLLGASLVLALFCAVLTVRMTTDLFRRMEWQAGELSRVSWHMLENQENAARRFSHELHDELGQSLTAIKANLVAISSGSLPQIPRVEDCIRLVDQSVDNIRQLSHLLHPTILDDFGLDEGLRWLAQGFTQRTGIEVRYKADLKERLPDETEIHLFRICQEALTNVARHSGATQVAIGVRAEGEHVYLSIEDNGRGLQKVREARQPGFGMIGMRARARNAGGELFLRSSEAGGRLIEVRVPALGQRDANENSDIARS